MMHWQMYLWQKLLPCVFPFHKSAKLFLEKEQTFRFTYLGKWIRMYNNKNSKDKSFI